MPKSYLIPDDWDGETWQCVQLQWPSSIMWSAVLRDLITEMARGRTWDQSTGQVRDVQSIGKAIIEYNIPFNSCEGGNGVSGVILGEDVLFCYDTAYNVNGGSSAAGKVRRPINTKVGAASWANIEEGSSFFIVLSEDGTYKIEAHATSYRCGRSFLIIENDVSTQLLRGMSDYSSEVTASNQTAGHLYLDGTITVAAGTKIVCAQYSEFAYATYGFGVAHNNSGINNRYTSIKITKLEEVEVVGEAGPPGPVGPRGETGPPGNAEGRITIRATSDLSHVEYKYDADPQWRSVISAPGELQWRDREITGEHLSYYYANKGPAYPVIVPGDFPGFVTPRIMDMPGSGRNTLVSSHALGGLVSGDRLCDAEQCERDPFVPATPDPYCEFATKMSKLLDDRIDAIDARIEEWDSKIEAVVILGVELGIFAAADAGPAIFLGLGAHIFLFGADLLLDDEFDAGFWLDFKCALYCKLSSMGGTLSDDDWSDFWQSFRDEHSWETEAALAFFTLFMELLSFGKLVEALAAVDVDEINCEGCLCGATWQHTYIFDGCDLDTWMPEPDVQDCISTPNVWSAKDQGDGTYVLSLVQYASWDAGADTRISRVEMIVYQPDPMYCNINWWGFAAIGGVNWSKDLRGIGLVNQLNNIEYDPPDLGPIYGLRFTATVSNLQMGVQGMPGVNRLTIWGTGTDPHPGHS